MKRIIYDIGACVGANLTYFLLKADLVVAVEANPDLCASICASYGQAIADGRLVVLNCVVLPSCTADTCDFFLHNANVFLGTCIPPGHERMPEYRRVVLPARSIDEIVACYGSPFYIKIDVEGADADLLRSLFAAGICAAYLSAEAHALDVFALLVGQGSYRAFKVVEGAEVGADGHASMIIDREKGEPVVHSFLPHSSGPFGNEIPGPWLNSSELMQKLASDGFGWKDIHASAIDDPDVNPDDGNVLDRAVVLKCPEVENRRKVADVDPDSGLRVAVVTPYFQEDLWKLARCHQSVIYQTVPCTHFLISDGPKKPEIVSWVARHIELGDCHRDNGNTPRGIGAICAMNEGYDAILFLDADNWYAEDHVASVLYTHLLSGADVVFSDRHIVFPDGGLVDKPDPEDSSRQHVDTSCISIFSGAFRSLAQWCLMPRELGPWCDRVMFSLLTSEFGCAWSDYRSVYFETWYVGHFMLAGMAVPADAKYLSHRELDLVKDRLNAEFSRRSYRTCEIRASGQADVGVATASNETDAGQSED